MAYRRSVRVIQEIEVAESIFGDTFATENRINVLTEHARTLWSQMIMAENGVAPQKRAGLYRNTGAQNSNITSDFKPEVVM